MQIVEVTSKKGALCAQILATLPDWFGIPESNAAYVRDVEAMPMFAAVASGRTLGFLALGHPAPLAMEVHVLGVRPEHHRAGAGRALIAAAAAHAKNYGARVLTVKTLSARHPDAGYAKTRAFYEATGFFAIEEFPLLWNEENPALLMLKIL